LRFDVSLATPSTKHWWIGLEDETHELRTELCAS